MIPLYNYIAYLLSAFAMLAVFIVVYTRITPIDEFALIRKGNRLSVLPVTAIKPAGEVAMPTPNGSAVIERNTKK